LIINITGGLGVKAVIINNGTSEATDIPWQVHAEGGILGRINMSVNGTISRIPAGGTVAVGKLIMVGLGPLSITVKVADEETTASGVLFLFFVIIMK
jgi:hypothetical protein